MTNETNEFIPWPKMPRLFRECIITEKIDGTNACVHVREDGTVQAGSRSRWITQEDDNYGFAAWVRDHADELRTLGVGRHFGEWWGSGIQRAYGFSKGERFFSLFNTAKWENGGYPACVRLVPILSKCHFSLKVVEDCKNFLRLSGSMAAAGFMRPEGVVVFHTAANHCFKSTLEKDEEYKGKAAK
jgi:hypothetical protein